ncbi:MAG TPA: class I SAM-dependent methyltransferase [Thermoanaerobaculia bacterium]|nr:class I SAM-dependent methyltransferase [Thermoanaerobaculia bacterium]
MNDERTADAFAQSWNRIGSVYTREQFLEWIAPLTPEDFAGREVLELGFGNGSLLVHAADLNPHRLAGLELGDTREQTLRNLRDAHVELHRGDLTVANLGTFDVVYCIGVLHHLGDPQRGFESVLRHTHPGGRFHCWVYAHEGNAIIRWIVDPIRCITSKLPWWLTKYAIALPLVIPYFFYAKLIARAPSLAQRMPLGKYALWIAREPFRFFHHVAFDQLVTPRTVYLRREEIERWLADPRIEDAYVIFRNGNSWKFGGRRASDR